MSTPARLADIIDALDMQHDESTCYVDRQTGRVEVITDDMSADAEEDVDLDGLPEWQRPMVEIARAIEADTEGRFVALPDRFEIDEWEMMRRFAQSVEDDAVAEALSRAIRGRGAFRYFKDKVHELRLAERWHAFREAEYRRVAVEWCEAHEVAYRDDVDEVKHP